VFAFEQSGSCFGPVQPGHLTPNDPLAQYKLEGDYLVTVNSGAWYQKANKNLVKDPTKYFLLPICFACDEIKLHKTGKTGCWSLLFSTTIFYQKLHNLSLLHGIHLVI
jgi:hypothetical protein